MSHALPPSNFEYGAVVLGHNGTFDGEQVLGHVIGFARNTVGEPILKVRWEDDRETTIHPAQVILSPDTWPKTWSQHKCLKALKDKESQREVAAPKKISLLRRLITLRP